MLKVRYSLVFDRKNKIPAKGEGLVQIQAYLNGGRRYFTTKMYIVEKEWDAKRNDFKDPYVAKSVRELINELETFEVNFRALHRSFALRDFDKMTSSEIMVERISFTKFYDEQL